ncbi:MAG: ABC transporter permease, partial [Candidatus Hodarchaeota archaeon]
MSAVPVGYEAFQSKRRKGVTLLCFLLASTMIMGLSVYVDSYSIHYWNDAVNTGDIAMIVRGYEVGGILNDIRDIEGVTKAASLSGSEAMVEIQTEWGREQIWTRVWGPTQAYLEVFPDTFHIIQGRMPYNESELAISIFTANNEWMNISMGDTLNYTSTSGGNRREVTVVGVFDFEGIASDDWWIYWEYYDCLGVVVPTNLFTIERFTHIHLDVDRSQVTPFNAYGSLAFLSGIQESIRRLDSSYPDINTRSRYDVSDLMSRGVTMYIAWQLSTRLSEIMRSAPIILLVILVSFLAIRFNVNERRYEASMLKARGASEKDVNSIVNREIAIMAVASCIFGLAFGIIASRVAIISVGFFRFDFTRLLTEPFLVTFESLILSLIIGIALPLLTLAGYRFIYSTKRTVETGGGRLSKFTRGLSIIKWDIIVV